MRLTISALGIEIGSIAGLAPSGRLLAAIHSILSPSKYRTEESYPIILDYYVSYTGDWVTILVVHQHGPNDPRVHGLVASAIREAARVAIEQGLCVAGNCFTQQPLEFAELEFEERPSEAFLLFTADHLDLKGLIPVIDHTSSAQQAVATVGPVMVIRAGTELLDSRNVLATFARNNAEMLPVPLNTPATYPERLPLVSCAAFSMHAGRLTEPVDCFGTPLWDALRDQATETGRAHHSEVSIQTVEAARK